jgi:hypothetical protein
VSAIVIGSHVRPSFYTAGSGAIYLDADHLWLTPEQRDVVSEVPDYRLAFDDALNYTALGRMVRNNAYARRSFSDTERVTRSSEELVLELGRLLYHELAHASDFFVPSARNLDPSLSIWDNAGARIRAAGLPSDLLAATYPLVSAEMKALGQVLYLGAAPTEIQKGYSAADVGALFGADRASDDYAYAINGGASSREDLALLFEEFMMSYRHGVQYDTAYSNRYVPGMSNADLLVGWGERGRIAEPAIKPRLKLVLERIAPWIDSSAVDSLPAPQMMTPGASWEANLILGSAARRSALKVGSGAGRRPARADVKALWPQRQEALRQP